MNDSDIVQCHGDRLAELRREYQVTQEQLADTAGYSVRVVRKAEKGDTVRFSTLTAFATALQRFGASATAIDLCTNPISVAQAFVEAYRVHEANMVDQIRHLLSHDLHVYIAGDPELIPFAGTYRGPDGLQTFWNTFFSLIKRFDKSALDLQYFVNGNQVVAYGTERGRLAGQANDEETWLSLKFEVRSGQIVRFEDYFDTAAAQKTLQEFKIGMQLADDPTER